MLRHNPTCRGADFLTLARQFQKVICKNDLRGFWGVFGSPHGAERHSERLSSVPHSFSAISSRSAPADLTKKQRRQQNSSNATRNSKMRAHCLQQPRQPTGGLPHSRHPLSLATPCRPTSSAAQTRPASLRHPVGVTAAQRQQHNNNSRRSAARITTRCSALGDDKVNGETGVLCQLTLD